MLAVLVEFSFFSTPKKIVPDTLGVELISIDALNSKILNKPKPTPAVQQTTPPSPQTRQDDVAPEIKKKITPPKKHNTDKSLNQVFDNIIKEDKVNNQFSNMLKNVEKKKPPLKKTESKTPSLDSVISQIDSDNMNSGNEVGALSLTEEEMIRSQIYPNWFVPAGIKNAESIIVEIEVNIAESGEVISARILDEKKCMAQQNTRVAAESAKRAVILSSPIKIPPVLRGKLRKFVLRFNPKDILN